MKMLKMAAMLATIVSVLPVCSHAGIVNVTLSGRTTASDDLYSPVGDRVTIQFDYDTSVAAGLTSFGQSFFANAVSNLSVSLQTIGYSGSASGAGFGQLRVNNFAAGDQFNGTFYSTLFAGNYTNLPALGVNLPLIPTNVAMPGDNIFGDLSINYINFNLVSTNPGLFTSAALPTTLSLSDFDSTAANNFQMGLWVPAGGYSFGGQIDTLTFRSGDVAVPEPASLALLGMGLAGLGFRGRRKR